MGRPFDHRLVARHIRPDVAEEQLGDDSFGSDDDRIVRPIGDLPAEVRGRGSIPSSGGKRAFPRRRRSTALDRLTLEEALRRTRGNISETARLLSVSRMTIYRKIEEFRIDFEN
ncbi:helix-turn-helix domain-containing protein [Kyrpidia tusciae]|uniref:helix-turn-helix domain-containing protein n=1 Tax=Kyrpidia tusciae TaxID=33943 RepID=UPI0003098A90